MKNLEKKLLIVAIVGKSGVGKTVIKNLITKTLSMYCNFKVLLIDGDSTHPHLTIIELCYLETSFCKFIWYSWVKIFLAT